MSWIKEKHPCGCRIKFNKSGAIELDKVVFCDRHFPLRIAEWTPEDKLAHIIENLEVKNGTIIWELKHGINDSCFHCEKEHAMSKRGILKQFVMLLKRIGTKDGRIMSVRKSECPFCDKTNFLYCAIINFKGEDVAGWDYYPFPTKEHVEAYERELRKGNIENAQMYKPKAMRPPKSYIA